MDEPQFDVDLEKHKAEISLLDNVFHAHIKGGKSFGGQIREILKLGRNPSKLSPQDYFYFQLYDDAKYTSDEKSRFLGESIHWSIIRKCCDPDWWVLADDKHVAYTLLSAYGAPTPETQCIYHQGSRSFGNTPTCHSPEELHNFFVSEAGFPLFVKPNGGVGSFGVFFVEGYEPETREVLLAGDERASITQFAGQISGNEGYLLQSNLKSHSDVAAICSNRVSTVRVIIILQDGQPEIIQSIWKIPAGDSIADNFWRKGNMLGAIDPGTGKVSRVIRGYGTELEEIKTHPQTEQQIEGITLPHWQEVTSLCLKYSQVFDKIRYQSWDVALCPEGPVVVEVNTGSAFNLSQLATGKGFMTDRFREFLDSCGYFSRKSFGARLKTGLRGFFDSV